MDESAGRSEVEAIRLNTGLIFTRVSIVRLNGYESNVWFATSAREAVQRALESRGWPTMSDREVVRRRLRG